MRSVLFLLCFVISVWCYSAEIKIGLFYGKTIESVVVSVVEGQYRVTGNSGNVTSIQKGAIIQIELSELKIYLHNADESYGPFEQVSFNPESKDGIFMVRPVFPALLAKESDDRLEINPEEGSLKLINTIDLEKYLAGTVEAEGGANALPEYYKAQAILARTFAVRNYFRHAHQGFNICDGVHCQAFNGKSRMNKAIYSAVGQTEGLILTDKHGDAVITAYHSSCGGMTSSASVEWNRDLDYLIPVADPFCDRSGNLNWTRTITIDEWNNFLEKFGQSARKETSYSNGNKRVKYLGASNNGITMSAVRGQFNLKSSWFSVENKGAQVVLHGHGYGHGLGMCQEGAMEMARVGYTYVDILMFYFRGLEVKRRT